MDISIADLKAATVSTVESDCKNSNACCKWVRWMGKNKKINVFIVDSIKEQTIGNY